MFNSSTSELRNYRNNSWTALSFKNSNLRHSKAGSIDKTRVIFVKTVDACQANHNYSMENCRLHKGAINPRSLIMFLWVILSHSPKCRGLLEREIIIVFVHSLLTHTASNSLRRQLSNQAEGPDGDCASQLDGWQVQERPSVALFAPAFVFVTTRISH